MSEIVDKIIANVDQMIEARKDIPRVLTETEKQDRYVMAGGDRCARCGDLTWNLLPGGAQFCSPCVALFLALDTKSHGGEFWWFSKMLHEMSEGATPRDPLEGPEVEHHQNG
jgi:hypothetical protein